MGRPGQTGRCGHQVASSFHTVGTNQLEPEREERPAAEASPPHVHQEGVPALDVLLGVSPYESLASKKHYHGHLLTAPSEKAMPLSIVAEIHAQARCGQNCIPLGRASGVPIPVW